METLTAENILLAANIASYVLAGIIAFFCIIRGIVRKTGKGIFSLISAVLCIPIAIIATHSTLNERAVQTIYNSAQQLGEASTVIPTLSAALVALAQIFAGPLVFVCIYIGLRIILGILGLIFLSLIPEDKFGGKRHGFLGLLLGAVTAAIVIVAVLSPLAGTIYTLNTLVEETGSLKAEVVGEEALQDYNETVEALADMKDLPVYSIIYNKAGGKLLYNGLTQVTFAEEKVTLEGEIKAYGTLANIMMQLYAESDMNKWGEEQEAALRRLPEVFEKSVILRVTGSEVISGASKAWLAGKDYIGVEKPELETVAAAALDAAMVVLQNTTKDTVVEDIGSVANAASVAVKLMRTNGDLSEALNDPEKLKEMVNTLLDEADSELLRTVAIQTGVEVLAESLGLPESKEEITQNFTSELANISKEGLTQAEATARVKALNDKYLVGMSDEECASLAAVILANPYEDGSQTQKAPLYPAFDVCVADGEATFALLADEEQSYEEWLKSLAGLQIEYTDESGEKKTAALPEFIEQSKETGKIEVPSELVTAEDLRSLITPEMVNEIGKEEMKQLISSAVEAINGDVEVADVATLIGALGDITENKPETKKLVAKLVGSVLQSDKVVDQLGISREEANQIASLVSQEDGKNFAVMAGKLSKLIDAAGKLESTDPAVRNEGMETFRDFIVNIEPTEVDLLMQLATKDTLHKSGIRDEYLEDCTALARKLVEQIKAARTDSSINYKEEAESIFNLLRLLIGGKQTEGHTVKDWVGVDAATLVATVADSKILAGADLAKMITDMYDKNEEALGLRKQILPEGRAELHDAIVAHKTDAAGEAMLKALGRILGYDSKDALCDTDLWAE